LHSLSTTFVLGYHGCDRAAGEKLLKNEPFQPSTNDYDWLGSGIYFWESNPVRALDWARECAKRKKIKNGTDMEPFVVGAVIDLGFCLDLISSNGINAVEEAYQDFSAVVAATKIPLPENKGGDDLLFRRLDCAVIQFLHGARERAGEPAFDTVRGVFTEGDRVYENSGFRRKTHIQLCVVNPESIKGVFRVPDHHFTKA
jgi:hypothetical protein